MTRSRARALFLAVGFLPSAWASAQSPTWQDVSPTTATFLDCRNAERRGLVATARSRFAHFPLFRAPRSP